MCLIIVEFLETKFALNKNSRHVDIFFDVDRSTFNVIDGHHFESRLLDQTRNFLDVEEVGQGAVLTSVMTITDFGVGLEPAKAIGMKSLIEAKPHCPQNPMQPWRAQTMNYSNSLNTVVQNMLKYFSWQHSFTIGRLITMKLES